MGGTVGLINLTDGAVLSEDELVTRAGEGDRSAFGALYLRHREAARRAAGLCTSSSADAEDAVAEGFAKVFAALPRLAGRPIAFRAYLLTCVRNAATDRLRRERRIDLRESIPEERVVLESASDTALAGVERNLVGEAMQALPRRWRTVLWLTEVEGMTPAQVSSQIGIKPNAVAALAYRARRGLRDAYLQAHLRQETTEGCRGTVSRLGLFVRGDLGERERELMESHLDECGKCRSRREELTDVNATIRAAFLPVPLLLAGLKGRWLEVLGKAGVLGRSPVEAAQLGAIGDSPMVHKAVAGIAALLMAVSAHGASRILGASDDAPQASPVTVIDTAGSGLDFAVLPPDQLGGGVLVRSRAAMASRALPEAARGGSGAAGGSPAEEAEETATNRPPGSRSLVGGTQSRFRGREGDARQPDKGDDSQVGDWLGGDRDGDGADPLGVESVVQAATELADEILGEVLAAAPVEALFAEVTGDPLAPDGPVGEDLERVKQQQLSAEERVAAAKATASRAASQARSSISQED